MTEAQPHDDGAEQIVLGSMMASPAAANEAAALLRARDFYRPAHGIVFTAIAANLAAREPVDPVAVAHQLQRRGELARVGGGATLAELIEAVPVAASVGHYALIVADRARLRDLEAAGTQIVQLAREQTRTADEAVNTAHAVLVDATSQRRRAQGTTWGDLLGPLTDEIEAAGRGDGPTVTTTGLVDLDKVLGGGFRAGQLVTVAGRPGMGKSVLVVDFARHVAFHRREPVVVFSLEMSRTEIGQRIIAAEASIDLSLIQAGTNSESAWRRISDAAGRTGDAPLVIEDAASLDLVELRAAARHHHQRHGRLGLVVVDYLQLLTAGRRIENRVQEVSELSRGLKLLAKELECPVVTASQLNRGPEGRADKRPQLSDLRESGSVEQDSDIVILLHRPEYYDKDDRKGEIDLDIRKHRNGQTGTITAAAQLWFSRINSFAMES